eukprot:m.218437 g.218437  ORF g.218437 m.218437 type:complete len:70 (-) comp18682_c1_seq6:988-1197(-)
MEFDVAAVIQELRESMQALETQVERFEKNCEALLGYQESVLTVCESWTRWLQNASRRQRAQALMPQALA